MEKDKRQGWLKELKVGDEVFVASGRGAWDTSYTISVVEKITPTGKINVAGKQFSPQGHKREGYHSTWLKELTPENKQEYLLEKQRTSLLIHGQPLALESGASIFALPSLAKKAIKKEYTKNNPNFDIENCFVEEVAIVNLSKFYSYFNEVERLGGDRT